MLIYRDHVNDYDPRFDGKCLNNKNPKSGQVKNGTEMICLDADEGLRYHLRWTKLEAQMESREILVKENCLVLF